MDEKMAKAYRESWHRAEEEKTKKLKQYAESWKKIEQNKKNTK